MAVQEAEIIKNYDVLFAVRTGLTILVPKTKVLDCGVEIPVQFRISPDNPRDVVITAAGNSAVLKDLRKDYLDEAVERGVFMVYEMKDDEVVRCTPCNFARK
ncbi:MAG TPA: hypothetical protein VEF76_12555 [Patescibacteria group bacterium]|nr:hypothetical protein [Patescibacteria group bacterium]